MRNAWLLWIVLWVGCGPPAAPDAGGGCGTGPGSVEAARGGLRAMALPSTGGELPIVLGSQGGIHVVVAAWVRDMDLEMTLRYRLEDAGGLVGEETVLPLRAALFAPDGARYVRHPDLVVLDNETPRVEDFAGRTVDLVAEAVSVDGSHACDRRSVTLLRP